MNENITLEDIKKILAEVAILQKRNEEEIAKSRAEFNESIKKNREEFNESIKKNREEFNESIKKNNEEFAKSRAEYDKLQKSVKKEIKKAFNLFTTQWGRLMESLVEGEIIKLFNAQKIAVQRLSTRVEGSFNDEQYEFDIIAHNGTEIVVIEVKTTLNVDHVKRHLYKLSKAKVWMSEYKNHNVQGAVAYLKADQSSAAFAEKNGLWVIRATGNSASIVNKGSFEPAIF